MTECNELERGKGLVISCLIENKDNISDTNCRQFLNRMASIVFSDYRLMSKFHEACDADITKYKCGRMNNNSVSFCYL